MISASNLRNRAKHLYELADKTEDKAQRFEIVLKAMELESEADALGRNLRQQQPVDYWSLFRS